MQTKLLTPNSLASMSSNSSSGLPNNPVYKNIIMEEYNNLQTSKNQVTHTSNATLNYIFSGDKEQDKELRQKCNYLHQLLKDKRNMNHVSGVFHHIERLLDEGMFNFCFDCRFDLSVITRERVFHNCWYFKSREDHFQV